MDAAAIAERQEADGLAQQAQRDLSEPLVLSPWEEVIDKINPILRGWVKYFAIGHSSRCFSFIRNWVEMKIRRHLAERASVEALAGSGGAGNGCMARWDSSRSTASRMRV
jgi:hypothetical protein